MEIGRALTGGGGNGMSMGMTPVAHPQTCRVDASLLPYAKHQAYIVRQDLDVVGTTQCMLRLLQRSLVGDRLGSGLSRNLIWCWAAFCGLRGANRV